MGWKAAARNEGVACGGSFIRGQIGGWAIQRLGCGYQADSREAANRDVSRLCDVSAFMILRSGSAEGRHDCWTDDHQHEGQTEQEVIHLGKAPRPERLITRSVIPES